MNPTDCGSDTACLSWSCSGGKCGKDPAAEGTPLAQQTSGDCSQLVCDGQGSTKGVFDPADVQSDSNDCTVDACTMQGPTHTAKPIGTPCAVGLCNASQTCVAHIPVKCKLKNGGQTYTGCDGLDHPGLQITFMDPAQGACFGLTTDVGYCTPNSVCVANSQLGTCQ